MTLTSIKPTLTSNEVKALARCRREKIDQAVATGALRPCAHNPNRKGRTPAVLFTADEAMRWIASGSPTACVS